MGLLSFSFIIAVFLIFFVLVGLILARLYRRATREVSLIKTGAGGKRVIMDGGTIVIPLLHEIRPVNMQTLRLEVKRTGESALITKDRMRVDVGVEFYVSVQASVEGISRAAQTLGDRTFDVGKLREMIEGKLIDSLRSVAARMSMDELHENRSNFVQEVQNTVSNDLLKNGLELESVSLTALDQTPFEALDENNAFNAVGMRKLAEVIANSKKERAEIEAQSQVSVRRSAMEAEKLKIQIERDEEEARIQRDQQVAVLKAKQEAEIARSEELSLSEKERARIQKEEEIKAAEIARARSLEDAEIAKEREIEVANQERQIIINRKSEEESQARASADKARAEAVKAKEAIETARSVATAERDKQISLIAAHDKAEARREEAQGEADALTIKAEAKKKDYLAEAEGQEALAKAENALSEEIIKLRIQLARLEAMPKIIEQMVKPAEKIEHIRINQISGMQGGGSGNGASGGSDKSSPVNQAFDAMLGASMQLPVMKKLGEELGMNFDEGLAGVINEAVGDSGDSNANGETAKDQTAQSKAK